MAYSPNKYAKFQTGDKVFLFVNGERVDSVIMSVYLNETDDEWVYKLVGVDGWYTQVKLSKVL